MKTFVTGLIACVVVMGIILGLGAVMGSVHHAVHWMLIVGLICCLLAAVLAGGIRRRRVGPSGSERTAFMKLSGILFMVGFPNLVVAIVIFYVTLPQ